MMCFSSTAISQEKQEFDPSSLLIQNSVSDDYNPLEDLLSSGEDKAAKDHSRSKVALLPQTEVNGNFKDECKFLKQTIELAVKQFNETSVNKFALGTMFSHYKLNELVTVYKRLCD